MISILRSLLTALTILVTTIVLGAAVMLAAALKVKDRPGGIFDKVPRWWSRATLWAAGAKVRLHGTENLGDGSPRIFVSNHVSWFDVPALAAVLPRYKFVAKAELFKVPVFGWGIRAIGMVEIQRENRKAAFEAYETAAKKIREGNSVVVYPEGTRGVDYALRPFKKGPFVLAVAAGVPIVPVLLHGTIEALPRGSLRAYPGTINVHLLEPIPTAGYDYEHRDELMQRVRESMIAAMQKLYGVEPVRIAARGSPRDSAAPAEVSPPE
ncbi:MAG TPA: lysophospholipid acyltransferase family protein [Gemmatimonadaceae bacterium]|nr:lysophospholipid acyltransferase family protein [Gemmatimonadaceae bacterium]